MLWFGYSWLTHLQLGHRLYDPDGDNKYEAHVSLKFAGPTYGSKSKDDLVLCDQVILVKEVP